MLASLLFVLLSASPDAPLRTHLTTLTAASDVPPSLTDARKLAEELRYEEAVVEYQRYLGDSSRPDQERARALFELGFLHSVLGDAVSAQARGLEALTLDPGLTLPPARPAKERAFLEELRQKGAQRARLSVLPPEGDEAPGRVRARLVDPQRQVRRVLMRHAVAASGPFHSTALRCREELCEGFIPPPRDAESFTAFYYVEALDAEGNTLATAATAVEPLQLIVLGTNAWYDNPYLWGTGAAAVVVAAGLVYVLAPPPPQPRP